MKRALPEQPDTYFLPADRWDADQIERGRCKLANDPLLPKLLATIPGHAVVTNEFRQILAANQATCDWLGIDSLDEILGRRMGEVVGCVGQAEAPNGCGTGEKCRHCGIARAVAASQQNGVTENVQGRIARTDGSALDLEVSASPFWVHDFPVLLVTLRDISAEKRREVLERVFFHDILNTAGSALGLLQVMGDATDPDLPARLVKQVELLVLEIKSQRDLVLAENGQLEPRYEEVPVSELLAGLQALAQEHTNRSGRALAIDGVEGLHLTTDRALLNRVLTNLVKNALEATPVGGEVRMRVEKREGRVAFVIQNPGVMPESVRMQVFQRSFSTKGENRGIGTYSIRLFGERYLGGKVSFVSREPHGTVFTLELPQQPERQSAAAAAGPDPILRGTRSPDDRTRRVLLAEDDPVNQLATGRLLEKLGCTVALAKDGRAALAAMQRADFDLVLMDLGMPEMGGLEAARRIRDNESGTGKRVPLVALTGGARSQEEPACLAAGMDACLEKPLDERALQTLLGDLSPAKPDA